MAVVERALLSPERFHTFDSAHASYDYGEGGRPSTGDTILWDDLGTADVMETRDERIVRAFVAALAYLDVALEGDPIDEWRWGRLHRVRFETVFPLLGVDRLSVPPADDAMFPDGFPRHGDYGAVDVGNFQPWAPWSPGSSPTPADLRDRFMHGAGASQRLVVEMTPAGPSAVNVIPGGQSSDPMSSHFSDQAQDWIANRARAMRFTKTDVEAHVESRTTFTPYDGE